jgi:uncharacterized surface protein with fasciclin (FAS1) repeats
MNRRAFSRLALLTAAAIGLAACTTEPQQPTFGEIINSNQSFSTLAQALDRAGLVGLEGGPYTVFAPTNSAFAALPEGELDRLLLEENRAELAEILSYHIVEGVYPASELVGRTTRLTTISGARLVVDGFDGITIGDVSVTQPNVEASNGIIHVVNGVIIP